MKIKHYNEVQGLHQPHAYSLKHYVENTKVHANHYFQDHMTSWTQSQQWPLQPLN